MKRTKYLLLLAFCLTLTACGPKGAPEGSVSQSGGSSVSQSGNTSQPDGSVPDASEPASSVPDPSGEESQPPLTETDRAAAYDAACDYYLGTVFEVHELVEISPREGEITFQVNCSKGGVRVDPDRIISLERKNGTWAVVNEGY